MQNLRVWGFFFFYPDGITLELLTVMVCAVDTKTLFSAKVLIVHVILYFPFERSAQEELHSTLAGRA